MNTKQVIIGAASVATIACHASAVQPADYQFGFQMPFGDPASFLVTGPATGSSPDVQGDAILTKVEMASGEQFIHFYKPGDILNVQYTGDQEEWRVTAGTNCTVGLSDVELYVEELDGAPGDVSEQDREDFADLIFAAFRTNNLNNYVDCYSSASRFSFTIKFDLEVRDNDPEPDEYGEILYFERGSGSGNSWLKIRAVDEAGNALGPWLVLSPSETVQTEPITTVLKPGQMMGTVAIDVSRLGVTNFQYLEVSNDLPGEPAYTGGGDLGPDFKFMVVMTNEEQLREILFD